MTRAIDLPAHLQERPFAVAAALQAGVAPATLRRKALEALEAPFYGVRRPAHLPVTLRRQCEAAKQALPPSAVFSHGTAVRLLDLPLPHGMPDLPQALDVTVPRAVTRPRAQGIHGHRSDLRAEETVDLDGLAVTSPTRTWCDLAARWSLDQLVMLGDAVLAGKRDDGPAGLRLRSDRPAPRPAYRGVPVPSPDDLRATAVEWGARRGGRTLRQAGELVRAGVDSPPETDLRLLVKRAGLPEPVVNRDVVDDDGIWIHRPDLSWPRWRVGVDYDGSHHFTRGEAQLRRDSSRREDLRSIGWLLSVVTATDLYGRPLIVLRRIQQALLDRGASW
jgi:hypothetical protein